MYKPKHFTPLELMFSACALANGIVNVPTDWNYIENLRNLCEKILDPAREFLGSPIIVNSGYRNSLTNKKVKGVSTSYHLKGCAVDITTRYPHELDRLYSILKALNPTELIKYDNFIHVAYEKDN